jgi:YfiH family protein
VQAAGDRRLPAPALVCEPLLEWTEHLFTTRSWTLGGAASPSGRDGWPEVAAAIGVEPHRLRRLRQVHGATVAIATAEDDSLPDADIVISTQSDVAIAVQAADCVPLLIADRRTGAVAAAHAGWRGLAAQVPIETVKALALTFGSRPEDIVVAIGPAIGPCCYEVGEEVREAMMGGASFGLEASRWFTPGKKHSKWLFDTWAAARAQLEAAGVPAGQVLGADLCTASHPDAFCSYRRDGAPAGRMAAAIKPRVRPA